MIRKILMVALCVLALPVSAPGSDRYDPRLRFRTIATQRFDIHFHQGGDRLARRLAVIAEAVAAQLEPRLGRPRARVQVVLVDQGDLSNGWATPIPYNLIEIVAASPRGESIIGNTADWLRMVFTHEYTHILHLERSRGFLGAVGRVFGRNPFFYPNLFLPPWQIEGIATHIESARSREGRVPAGDFRLLLGRSGRTGFLSLDRASNDIVQWPGGQAAYLYGAYFHRYLAEAYGEESLAKLADATSGRLPYFGARAFKSVYGKSLRTLWTEFEKAHATRPDDSAPTAVRLTEHGFSVSAPWFSPDGRLFYSIANPHRFPALMELAAGGPRQVATRVAGNRLSGTGRELVFDQVEYVRSIAVQSDLYAADIATGRTRRLTKEARAGDPDVSPDGQTIVCTIESADGRQLALLPMPAEGSVAAPRVLRAEIQTQYASPRWSPDGRSIVAERRYLGEPSELVLIDPSTGGSTRLLTYSDDRNVTPVWHPDGRSVLFASDRDGGPFQLYSVDVESRALRRAGLGLTARAPALSRDGRTLVYVGYTPSGYDLFSIPVQEIQWHDATGPRMDVPRPPPAPEMPLPPPRTTTYSPLRTLVPRFWTPIVESEGDALSFGAGTGGADALGRHFYAGSAAWSTRGRPDWFAAYAYDRWRPTLFANASDDTGPWREGDVRVKEVNAGTLVRFRRVRRQQMLLASYHGATEKYACAECEPPVLGTISRRALRSAWTVDSSRAFGYSISAEEGIAVTAAAEWTRRAFGADGNGTALILDARGYRAAGPRHAVVAARLAGASSWGDDAARRIFAAGSSAAVPGGPAFGLDAIALIRGFDSADATGRRAAVLNVDYRVPIKWIERGVGTWPLFARSVHGAVFADLGAAWDDGRDVERRASFGVELSTDFVLAYWLPLTATAGVAVRDDPSGRSRGAAVFWRLGRAF